MTPPSPIDWGRAERVAVRIAERRPVGEHSGVGEPVAADLERIEARIEQVTGLRSPAGPARVEVIDRAAWVRANIASFRRLLTPVVERWQEAQPRRAGSGIGNRIAATELGAVLGWMSTRVLGQYDLLLGTANPHREAVGFGAAAAGDTVFLVGPNLAAVEARHGFRREPFRTWVLLHEMTHRAQFTGVPWMRDHFTGLVDESLAFVDPDPRALLDALREALRDREAARRHVRDNGIIGLVAKPEQRAVIARIGGLMSLLEGHGDVTMTRAAGDLVPAAARYARVLRERRRKASPMARVVQRLTGIEAKLNQYAAGERFVEAVEAAAGPSAVAVCWADPANLPSLEEVREPSRWLDRVGARAA